MEIGSFCAPGNISLGRYGPVPAQPLALLTGMRMMTTAADVNTRTGMAKSAAAEDVTIRTVRGAQPIMLLQASRGHLAGFAFWATCTASGIRLQIEFYIGETSLLT